MGASRYRERWKGSFRAMLLCVASLVMLSAGAASQARGSERSLDADLRVYVAFAVSGALDTDTLEMEGGMDRAVSLIEGDGRSSDERLVLAAGSFFFPHGSEFTAPPEWRSQALLTAEALTSAARRMHLAVWAPGPNDLTQGTTLVEQLGRRGGATPVGGWPSGERTRVAVSVVERRGLRLGFVGVSAGQPRESTIGPPHWDAAGLRVEFLAARRALESRHLDVKVLLVVAPRDRALPALREERGFDLVVLSDPGAEDRSFVSPSPPSTASPSWLVEGASHLRELVSLDLNVRKAATTPRQLRLSNPVRHRLDASAPSDAATRGDIRAHRKRIAAVNRDLFATRDVIAAMPGQPAFVGESRCRECHQSASEFWLMSPHAKAYWTLANQDRQFDLQCVGCHVTGYERRGGSNVTHVDGLRDVQCEACHGPGSIHSETGRPESITSLPDESVCLECHRAPFRTPNWNLDGAWRRILGPGHGT